MMGNQEVSSLLIIFGFFLQFMVIAFAGVSMFVTILLVFGMFMFIGAWAYLAYLISYNKLQPFINKINPEKKKVWLRVTKGKLFAPQIVNIGTYGQTKGIMGRHKADVIDKGDFPVRLMNGNPAIIVYDLSSHNQNLDEAVGWKRLFKKYKVSSGKEAYKKNQRKVPVSVEAKVDKLV